MKKIVYSVLLLSGSILAGSETNAQLCPAAGAGGKPVVVLPTRIQSNMTLTLGTDYVLDGKVFVENGATLFINNGVSVFGVKKADPNDASALIITKTGKISAQGSPEFPIVFRGCPTSPANGDWGGVVLLGTAAINQPSGQVIEGINTNNVPVGVDVTYGTQNDTTNDHQNSGVLNYVRIEYAGAAISANNELNGLTFGGVGRGTFVDFVETVYGADDGFEFFGGCVNVKHLISFSPDDDNFDSDFGYTGNMQFCVSVLNPTKPTFSSDPRGFEADNDAAGSSLVPISKPKYSNMTIIGFATQATAIAKAIQDGGRWRRNTNYVLRNSIIMGYPTGANFDGALGTPGSPTYHDSLTFNVIHAFTNVAVGATLHASNTSFLGDLTFSNEHILLVDPFNATFPDFRPQSEPASPALTGANFTGLFGRATGTIPGVTASTNFFQTTTYRGAFSPGINWNATWSRFANIGL